MFQCQVFDKGTRGKMKSLGNIGFKYGKALTLQNTSLLVVSKVKVLSTSGDMLV